MRAYLEEFHLFGLGFHQYLFAAEDAYYKYSLGLGFRKRVLVEELYSFLAGYLEPACVSLWEMLITPILISVVCA